MGGGKGSSYDGEIETKEVGGEAIVRTRARARGNSLCDTRGPGEEVGHGAWSACADN